ncbi:hypothetical protein ACFL27_02695 [candidate division CSSED10-310 bacterium]|uniref:Uncharacterized protein n=1 Tax=candidate division CSSED10-310 bacterium TaxID=2855610 RepID=A0ABV6YSB6_UNCC1
MPQIIVTTVIRNGSRERNGFVFEIDWTLKKIMHQFPLPDIDVEELGPRGGARGARGTLSVGGYHYIANFNTIFVYDDTWNLRGEIQHPLFNGLHEMDYDYDGLWVSSTGIDAILKLDWEGNLQSSLFFGELEDHIRETLQISERRCDHTVNQRRALYPNELLVTHVNSVKLYNERPYACLNKQGAIVALDPLEIIVPPSGKAGFHNGTRVNDDLLLVNSSYEKKLYGFKPDDGQIEFEIDWHAELKTMYQKDKQLLEDIFCGKNTDGNVAQNGWARGLDVLESGRVLIGFAPAMIAELDLEDKKIIDVFPLDDDVHHAVHGLSVVK